MRKVLITKCKTLHRKVFVPLHSTPWQAMTWAGDTGLPVFMSACDQGQGRGDNTSISQAHWDWVPGPWTLGIARSGNVPPHWLCIMYIVHSTWGGEGELFILEWSAFRIILHAKAGEINMVYCSTALDYSTCAEGNRSGQSLFVSLGGKQVTFFSILPGLLVMFNVYY